MEMKKYSKRIVFLMGIFFIITVLGTWFKPSDAFSDSERRTLRQFPELSMEAVLSGTFMSDFESYVTDQFLLRDGLRTVKAFFATKILGQKDNNGIYMVDGYASKLEYPLNVTSVQRAVDRFQYVYETYMKDTDVKAYYAVIPDKNYFLAEGNGYLAMDYEKLFAQVKNGMANMTYIDIVDLLSIEDYYKTDIHWRQENLLDVAERLQGGMGVEVKNEFQLKTLDYPFYGVYYGQSALPMEAETIGYYTNDVLDHCVVYDYQNNESTTIYDMGKAYGKDPYEMFLSGAISLMTIENPMAETDKELILFRDSFGSSMAPLLVESYAKITLVDIRYIHPDLLGKYIEFKDQDVLFLYSTSVLNNGETIK